MQLRHFRYFIAVAEEGSFLRAARRLHVAQPALSKQIHDLEREIGSVLFQRLPRGMKLTAAGRAFLHEARSTVENAARAVASARRAEEQQERLHFALGPMNVHVGILAELLAAFRATHPCIEVQLHRLNQTEQVAALREHRVDVATSYVSELPVAGFSSHSLLDCSITGVLFPAAHPLAQSSEVSLPQLRELAWLHAPRQISPDAYRVLTLALRRRGLVPAARHPTDPAAARVQIAAGNGWILANALLAQSYVSEAIVYRPFVEAPIPYRLVLIWLPDSPTPLVHSLVETARSLSLEPPVSTPTLEPPPSA